MLLVGHIPCFRSCGRLCFWLLSACVSVLVDFPNHIVATFAMPSSRTSLGMAEAIKEATTRVTSEEFEAGAAQRQLSRQVAELEANSDLRSQLAKQLEVEASSELRSQLVAELEAHNRGSQEIEAEIETSELRFQKADHHLEVFALELRHYNAAVQEAAAAELKSEDDV